MGHGASLFKYLCVTNIIADTIYIHWAFPLIAKKPLLSNTQMTVMSPNLRNMINDNTYICIVPQCVIYFLYENWFVPYPVTADISIYDEVSMLTGLCL